MRIGIIFFLFFIFTPTTLAISVIPGGVGFGIDTPAGRGGTIYKVTNLKPSGSGSLKACIDASGPRVCVFEVSGTIKINNRIDIYNPFLTVAGQTAPSPGIMIRGAGLNIDSHDVLIQHIRIRVGDDPNGPNPENRDALSIENYTSGDTFNIIIDHVSLSWAIDEIVSTWGGLGRVYDVTISNSIISEALHDSLHPKGPHGMGILLGRNTNRVVLINNLLAHNDERNPLVRDSVDNVVVVNNLLYNTGYEWDGSRITFGSAGSLNTLRASAVGNKLILGPDSGTKKHMIYIWDVPPDTSIYVEDNEAPGRTSDPWSVVKFSGAGSEVKSSTKPIWVSGLNTISSSQIEDYVLANAGARPADRDPVDTRVIESVKTRTGKIINSQNDVGGWPNLARVYRALTIPSNPNGDSDGDGYTNLEEWLHDYAKAVEGGGTAPPPPTSNSADINSDGRVDVTDLGILLSNWGSSGSADINGDGVVDVVDLGVMLSGWSG